MYKCNECGATFSHPHVRYERHGFDFAPYETVSECPECFGSDFEEVKDDDGEGFYLCEKCGKTFDVPRDLYGIGDVCPFCGYWGFKECDYGE